MAKVYVIRQLPVGNSPEARAERSHLQGSRWGIRGVPGDGALAGKPYFVDEDTAAALINSGWVLCDQSGKPTGATLPPTKPAIRSGTQEWKDLPPEERFGSEEWRDAELQRQLDAATEAPAPEKAPETIAPETAPEQMLEHASTDESPSPEEGSRRRK